MLAYLIGSVLFAVAVLADIATSERLDDRDGATEQNPAFRDAEGKHSTTKRALWALLFAGFAAIGAYVQWLGLWPGALLWVGCYVYVGGRAVGGALGNLGRMRGARRNRATAAAPTDIPTAPASPRMDLAGEGGHRPRGRSGDTDGRH
jgi:hypothetical protein